MSQTPDTIDPLFKLKNSPLQGVEAYRSPFYRRLLSAGYKGYIQGSLGGATLFATLGALAGGLIILGGAALGVQIATTFLAVPIMAVGGVLYGKDAFGTIGAMAAISAEQAEMNEKRRSLLDRYYETPSKEEAKAIEEMLQDQSEEKMPKKWFHWKAALLGAVVVGAAAALILYAPTLIANIPADSSLSVLKVISKKLLGDMAIGSAMTASTSFYAGAIGIGALVGSLVGIDRAYIRKWFDVQEKFHDDTHASARKIEHQQNVERLQQAYRREGYGLEARGAANEVNAREGSASQIKPISPRTVSDNALQETPIAPPAAEKPKTTVQAKEASVSALVENMRAPVASL